MRKLIVAATALAFLSSTAAFAQGTAPSTTAPGAQSDTMSKGDTSGGKMAKTTKKKSKKSSKAKSESEGAK
jgi:basic membrane lipoprotein Med (substrate-binding protein (PBP1-ABC) superfamily)